MKKITPNTILKQGDKTFTAVEVDGNIIWIDKTEFADETIAQSSPILKGIPVISLDSYVERLAEIEYPYYEGSDGVELFQRSGFINGFKSNPAKWTDEDMERAIEMAINGRIKSKTVEGKEYSFSLSKEEIMDKISEISEIEVDNDFNVISIK